MHLLDRFSVPNAAILRSGCHRSDLGALERLEPGWQLQDFGWRSLAPSPASSDRAAMSDVSPRAVCVVLEVDGLSFSGAASYAECSLKPKHKESPDKAERRLEGAGRQRVATPLV